MLGAQHAASGSRGLSARQGRSSHTASLAGSAPLQPHHGWGVAAQPLCGCRRGGAAPAEGWGASRGKQQIARVLTPARPDAQPLSQQAHPAQPSGPNASAGSGAGSSSSGGAGKAQPGDLLAAIVTPVAADMEQMNSNLRHLLGDRHPMLMAAAEQIFGAGGKKLRPMIVFLVARATAHMAGLEDITERHRRLAEIIEMIHTASLVHDDVLDDCSVRRGKDTINTLYGTRVAVLAGDFLFAQSSWLIANLENMEVIKLISRVIADFANGEISQASSLFDTGISLQAYLEKSYYKTASLIAASCRSSAVFSGMSEDAKEAMYAYGKHLGLAFQVVDDILDFTQTAEQLGKPQGQDLASGNLTAPAIYALQQSRALEELIQSEFVEEGSLQQALALVESAGGIAAARQLAEEEAALARGALRCLPDSEAKRSLELMVDYVLERIH